MAYCRNCGADMPATAKFCQECGQDQSVSVPQDQRIQTEDVPVPPPPAPTEDVSVPPSPHRGGTLPTWAKGLLIIGAFIVLALSFALSPLMFFVAILVLIVAIGVLIFRVLRGRPLRNWSLIAAAALLLVFAYGGVSAAMLGRAPQEAASPSETTTETADNSPLEMGETATLSSGDTVTVYSYESPVSLDGPLKPKTGSEIALVDAEFCAGQGGQEVTTPILSQIHFSLLMPDNAPVQSRSMGGTGLSPLLPSGENLFEAGDCGRGYVGFEKPEGQDPKFVLYRGSSPLSQPFRWAVE